MNTTLVYAFWVKGEGDKQSNAIAKYYCKQPNPNR